MVFDRGGESVDHQCVLTKRESHLGELLDRDDPQFSEARDLRARGTEITRVRQCGTPPQIERGSQQANRGPGIAAAVDLPGKDDQSLEALHVELVGFHPQEVSVRARGQPATGRARIAVQLEDLT